MRMFWRGIILQDGCELCMTGCGGHQCPINLMWWRSVYIFSTKYIFLNNCKNNKTFFSICLTIQRNTTPGGLTAWYTPGWRCDLNYILGRDLALLPRSIPPHLWLKLDEHIFFILYILSDTRKWRWACRRLVQSLPDYRHKSKKFLNP